mgnify:CR=1 FL=1
MAYKQNFGRDNLTNLNIATLTNGGTDPETDPVKPFEPVDGEFNETLPEITITGKGNKPVTGPSNRAESIERQKQIKAGYGNMLDISYDSDNAVINQTTSTVEKIGTDGQPYSMTRNSFVSPQGGTATNVDTTPSQAFIGPQAAGKFFNSNEDRAIVQNSTNYMNSPAGQKRRGSEMQNFGTFVEGGKDSGKPLKTYMQNLNTGSIVGQLSGEGTMSYLGQGQNKIAKNRIGEFSNKYGYTKLLDGHSRSNQTLLNLKPAEAQAFIREDSLLKQRNRFTNLAHDAAVNHRNSMFRKPDLTSGSEN